LGTDIFGLAKMATQMDADITRTIEPNARELEYKGRIVGRFCVIGLSGSNTDAILFVTQDKAVKTIALRSK
jgi:hypothetical protein